MPPRSAIAKLPEILQSELNRRIEQNAFGGYADLSEWLQAQGYEISRSALQAYGSQFEKKMGALRVAVRQAKAIAEATGDDANAMGEALVMLAQEKAFQVLMDMDIDPEGQDFSKLTRSIADLNRAAVQQKKFADELKAKAVSAAEESVEVLRAEGISDETAAIIRAKFLGLAT